MWPTGLAVSGTLAFGRRCESTYSLGFPCQCSYRYKASSVTVWEDTVPVKLPRHPWLDFLLKNPRFLEKKNRGKAQGSSKTFSPWTLASGVLVVKLPGSSCPVDHRPHLHGHFKFAEPHCETASVSWHPSCRTLFRRQGVSLKRLKAK